MNELSTQEAISSLIALLNNSTLYLAIGAFVVVCMLVLLLINKKSGTFLVYYAVAFASVGGIFYALPSASDAIIQLYAEEYATVASSIITNLLAEFKSIGFILLIVAAACIVIFIIFKVVSSSKAKKENEKKIDSLSDLNN